MMHWTEWITRSLRGELASPWVEVVLALGAVACGAIIGAERERHDKPAGLRTLILVSLGATVFTLVSFAFTSTTDDSGRVAAQVVTGIGFLGAGAILHSRSSVTGMTTAATIWVTAAIGITVGVGHLAAGLGLSVLVYGVLIVVRGWEIHHSGGMKSVSIEIVFDPDHGKAQIRLDRIREEYHVRGPMVAQPGDNGGNVRARMDLRLPRRHLHEFLDTLAALPAVREIRELRSDASRPEGADPTRRC